MDEFLEGRVVSGAQGLFQLRVGEALPWTLVGSILEGEAAVVVPKALAIPGVRCQLTKVEVMKTKIDGSGFHHLERLRNLKRLRLGGLGASMTDDKAEALKKSLGL